MAKKLKRSVKSKAKEETSAFIKHNPSEIPTSIIMSGVESSRYWDIVVNQCEFKTVLMSYHYLRKKPKNFLRERLEKTPDVKVFIDSGAYTFISNIDKYIDKPNEFWEEYLEEYTEWVKENKAYIFACADLDIDDIVGQDRVDEWRAKFFEPLRNEGIDVCYIWHETRGDEGWRAMCQRYDYVGLSTENDSLTLQAITRMVNIAKKNHARVHGMAVTKTDLLVRVPLFSSDSTSWLVGQQYGELNWFDGRGMKRLDKKTWRTTYKTRLLKAPFFADWDLLINGMGGRGDTYELLRLNVIAYKLAEEHIRKRLRTKMYWLVENSDSVEEDFKKSIDEVQIPDLKWFETGVQEDYKFYLRELHLPTDIPKEEAVDILYSFYLYIKDDGKKLEVVPTHELLDYCKSMLNKEVATRDEAIDVIKSYYIENALGLRRDFVTPEEDESINRPKERDDYLEDEAFTTIDLSSSEVENFLPAPEFPEVEAYDEELKRMDITPVRDSKGRFLKGQKKVRKPKSMYSDKMPKLNCDTCYKSGDCPEYRAGYVCAFNKMFKKFDTRSTEDVLDAMHSMVNVNLERMQRAMMFETMDGGMVTPEVSALIDQNMKLLSNIKDLSNAQTLVSQRRVIREDGTEETITSASVNPNQGGILSKIFGNNSSNDAKSDSNIVDTDYHEVKSE